MPDTQISSPASPPAFDTILLGASARVLSGRPQELHPGMQVKLRADHLAGGWPRFDVLTGTGDLLGKLPAEDACSLGALSGDRLTLDAEITALVPTRLGSRVHLRVNVPF